MVFKSKYWILEKNKGFFLSEYLNFEELKGSHKGIQYWISFKLQPCCRFWRQLQHGRYLENWYLGVNRHLVASEADTEVGVL